MKDIFIFGGLFLCILFLLAGGGLLVHQEFIADEPSPMMIFAGWVSLLFAFGSIGLSGVLTLSEFGGGNRRSRRGGGGWR